jgi:hypothetical protein
MQDEQSGDDGSSHSDENYVAVDDEVEQQMEYAGIEEEQVDRLGISKLTCVYSCKLSDRF